MSNVHDLGAGVPSWQTPDGTSAEAPGSGEVEDGYGPAGPALALLYRRLDAEWRRRRITAEAFRLGTARWRDLASAAADAVRDGRTVDLHAEIEGVMPLVLALPRPAAAALPPLPSDRVAVAEVLDLLRRVLAGRSDARMVAPPLVWSDVWHETGDLRIDGWTVRFSAREGGISYTVEAVSPDGRRSDQEAFEAREGDPLALLSDEEQELLDAMFARMEADPDATREAILSTVSGSGSDRRQVRERVAAWLTLKGAAATDATGSPLRLEERARRLAAEERGRLSAADLELLWEIEDLLAEAARKAVPGAIS